MNDSHRYGIEVLDRFATDVIQRLGDVALEFYGKKRATLRFDEELLTEAELQLRRFFQEEIKNHFPEHQVFMNTDLDKAYSHDEKRYLWIFDPIDGADNFQTGIPIWGMSLALLENFWPILGVFHMPATGDLFHALAGRNAFRGSEQIGVLNLGNVDDESLLLTYSRFHQQYRVAFPGKIRNLGCTAAHIGYVAMGRADAAVISNESFQDLAAARVIIEAAGGKFFKMDGSVFFLNDYLDGGKIGEPILVSSDEKCAAVLECIQKAE